MSIERRGDRAIDDWTECLLLTVAPQRHMARVTDAVDRGEQALLDDAVLGDMGRVAASTSARLLDGGVDALAAALYREFVMWSLSPARNRAPRTTFSLLLIHPDATTAARLVRQLADTEVLSRLPIVFRTGGVDEPLDESLQPAPPPTTDTGEVTRMILDAVRHTAGEIEQVTGFAIDQRQLRGLAARPPAPSAATDPVLPAASPTAVAAAPARHPALEPASPPARHAAPVPLAIAGPPSGAETADTAVAHTPRAGAEADEVVRLPRHGDTGDGPDPDEWRDPDDSGETDRAGDIDDAGDTADKAGFAARVDPRPGLGRLVRLAKELFTDRRPASTVEVIDELSRATDRVLALYLIMVSDPVPPPRRERDRRAEVALEVARTVLTPAGPDPWYVRVFTADRHLRPAAPLPKVERLGRRDFRWKWGEYLELFDCIGDIRDTMQRDAASFVRRGVVRPPETVVLFLAGEPPANGVDTVRRLSGLCEDARVVWLSFAAAALDPAPEPARSGARFLRDHEDVVVEVVQLLGGGTAADR